MAGTRIDRWLVALFGAVVLIFVGATWFAQERVGQVEEAALRIQGDVAAKLRRLAADLDAKNNDRESDMPSQAIDASAREAAALADEIREIRRRGRRWAVGMDLLGVLLAGLAAYLCVRLVRSHARVLESYRKAAEDRAGELDTFATRVAHDLLTPLTALRLSMASLEQASTEDRRDMIMRRAMSALSQTTLIVEGLLDFARSGAHPEGEVSCSVTEVASQVCTAMRPQAEQAGAVLSFDSHSHSTVACSAGVLSSVVSNLVGNALSSVENARERYVRVTIVDDDREVVASISDTGAGLPAGVDPEELFRPFVRGKSARGEGLGLGLNTVKRIVEAHHGRTGVLSGAAGCCFWIRLPRATAVSSGLAVDQELLNQPRLG